jgi:hypothetical protein
MPTTITLKELKAKLKPLGFTVRTCKYAFSHAGWIVRLSDKVPMPSLFAGEEERAKWGPAIEAITDIVVFNGSERVSGPWATLRNTKAKKEETP